MPPLSRRWRRAFRVMMAVTVLGLGLVCAQATFRYIDHYSLRSARFIRLSSAVVAKDRLTVSHVDQLPIASGVDRGWFALDPERPSGGVPTQDKELNERFRRHEGLELAAVCEWNLKYLRSVICEEPSLYDTVFKPFEEVFTYVPEGGAPKALRP